jgi:hypothetical protein
MVVGAAVWCSTVVPMPKGQEPESGMNSQKLFSDHKAMNICTEDCHFAFQNTVTPQMESAPHAPLCVWNKVIL